MTNHAEAEGVSSTLITAETRLLYYFSTYQTIRKAQDDAHLATTQVASTPEISGAGHSGQGKAVLKRQAITNTSKGSKGVHS